MEINIVELASETSFSYVQNLAEQLKEEHSIEDNGEFYFTERYQEIFNDVYDVIYSYIEEQGFKQN